MNRRGKQRDQFNDGVNDRNRCPEEARPTVLQRYRAVRGEFRRNPGIVARVFAMPDVPAFQMFFMVRLGGQDPALSLSQVSLEFRFTLTRG